MARLIPPTDRPRPHQKSRFWPRLLSAASIASVTLAPVAALSLWLLISDPVTAASVMERGSLFPLLAALANMIGKALVSVMTAI